MPTSPIRLAVAACCVLSLPLAPSLLAVPASAQQLERQLFTEKGSSSDALAPHPLAWWTENPLRDDTSGDLMLGSNAPDGKPLTLADYQLEKKITTLGVIAGYKIVQVRTTIKPGPRVIAAGWGVETDDPAEWKDLLVGPENGDSFVEIYALHMDGGGLVKGTDAAIYGEGPGAVLGTYDPDTGNGGGCWDGYWWFDSKGPHAVDFSPLEKAVAEAIPDKQTRFTSNCYALHPQDNELKSGVQRIDAECHACGWIGNVTASYRIEHGVAKPLSVRFEPSQP